MKKKLLILLLVALISVTTVTPSMAYAKVTVADEEQEIPYHVLPDNVVSYQSIDPIITADAEPVRFTDPELAATSSSSGYMYSYYKYVSHIINKYDSRDTINPVFLLSVARGQTLSVTKTVKTSGSIEFRAGISTGIKDLIAEKVNASSKYVCTFSVKKTEEFTFPEGATGNTVSFYMAIGYDETKFTVDRYDVYMKDETIGGLGISYEHRYYGRFTKTADIPKKVIYSIIGTAG